MACERLRQHSGNRKLRDRQSLREIRLDLQSFHGPLASNRSILRVRDESLNICAAVDYRTISNYN